MMMTTTCPEMASWQSTLDPELRTLQRSIDKELRRVDKDLYNRLHSIRLDADFVSAVASHFQPLPLVANLRCGAWYTDPTLTRASCYFKSTDGHLGQWAFSLKRHNLSLAKVITQNRGCIIVDSTRSGKTMPDALSKTIPIWCAVLNKASNIKHGTPTSPEYTQLRTPEHLVSRSEHAQIEAGIDRWASQLLDSDLSVPRLDAPLRPFFVTTDTDLSMLKEELDAHATDASNPPFHPVILLSASRARSQALEPALAHSASAQPCSFYYVQGSGDDHENWALGLTPALFWAPSGHERLLAASRGADIEAIVKELVEHDRAGAGRTWASVGDQRLGSSSREAQTERGDDYVRIGQTRVWLGTCPSGTESEQARTQWRKDVLDRFALVVHCDGVGADPSGALGELRTGEGRLITLGLKQGKAGVGPFGYHLLSILSALIVRMQKLNFGPPAEGTDDAVETKQPSLLICDTTGRDLSPALAVAFLSSTHDGGGVGREPKPSYLASDSHRWAHQVQLDKDQIRRRLQWVMTALGDRGDGFGAGGGPARAYLNRINAELLGERGRKARDYA
ncbi:hypothetical protein V8E36_003071 [Tilletia maclaganii]